jgi:hypothetical protein
LPFLCLPLCFSFFCAADTKLNRSLLENAVGQAELESQFSSYKQLTVTYEVRLPECNFTTEF